MTATSLNLRKGGAVQRVIGDDLPGGDGRPPNDIAKLRSTRDSKHDSDYDEESITHTRHGKIVKAWFDGFEINLASKKYQSELLKKNDTAQNLIHRAIIELRKRKKKGLLKAFPLEAVDRIEELVLREPKLFTEPNETRQIPTFEAPRLDASVLFRVINQLIPHDVVEKLEETRSNFDRCPDGTCPLWSVSDGRRKQCQKESEASKRGENTDRRNANPERNNIEIDEGNETDGEDEDTMRCLHGDIDAAKVLAEDRKLRKTLEMALNRQAYDMCLKPLLVVNKFDRGQKENAQIIPLEDFKILLWLCPDEVFSQVPTYSPTPLQLAVQLYEHQSIDYELLFSVIEALVERYPESIFLPATVDQKTRTAYRLLKELRKAETEQNTKSRAKAEELLKRICIGFRRKRYDERKKAEVDDDMWTEKKQFLYWNAKQRKSLFSPT